MTAIGRDELRETAELCKDDPYAYVADAETVLALLDALSAAEHRATRAEAQSAIRGRAVAIYQRRAREAEAERDWNWRSSRHSKLERIKANARADKAEAERDMLLDDLRKAEQRADQAEARVRNLEGTARVLVREALDAETARDEHRRRADGAEAEARTQRHRADDMEDNALRAQTNRRAAEERIEAVRELHTRTWHGELDYCPRCVDFEGAIWPCKTIRILEGDTDG